MAAKHHISAISPDLKAPMVFNTPTGNQLTLAYTFNTDPEGFFSTCTFSTVWRSQPIEQEKLYADKLALKLLGEVEEITN